MKKISIVLDAQTIAEADLTGVGKTTFGLIKALENKDLVLCLHAFGKIKHTINSPKVKYIESLFFPVKIYNLLRRINLAPPYELFTRQSADFYLFPAFLSKRTFMRKPYAVFFHDITYLLHPEFVSRRNCYDLATLMPGVVERASFVITNSESSKQGIMDAYDTPADKIIVEHIPTVDTVEIPQAEADKRVRTLGITGPYLLFFGTLEPRKNLVGLMQAYEQLPDDIRQKYTLVIGGKKGWNDEEILVTLERLRRSGAKVMQTGYVSDEDRAALFMNASLYLMPSHYEGFGMQLLEGMQYGCPMLVSDIPVLREVAGDASAYCATDPESIAHGITDLLKNPKAQQKLVAAGHKRLKDFSWDKVADDIYQRIAQAVAK